MTAVPWSTILDAADAAAEVLPQPFGVAADIAVAIGRALVARGCQVQGCPHDLRAHLKAADIPAEDEAMFRARAASEARVRGLDRASIEALRRGPIAVVHAEAAQRFCNECLRPHRNDGSCANCRTSFIPATGVTSGRRDLDDYLDEMDPGDEDTSDGSEPPGAA